jgi:hypothetical protein
VVPNPLEQLAEDEIRNAETLSVERRVHPFRFGIAGDDLAWDFAPRHVVIVPVFR